MTIWKTRSLAFAAAALMAGCATTNYYVAPTDNNYAVDNSAYVEPNNAPYADQYADQGDLNADADVSYDTFERELSPYGDWNYHPRWGEVWQPRVRVGFKPYFNGYWANTREYGWMWISDDPWGDLTYRYGRWVFDPRDGWMWVPGYVWGPSWVVWRSGGGSIGWFPMPPDDYYGNGPYRGNYASFYGYRDWYGASFNNDSFFSLWIFVGEDRFADRNYRNYVRPQRDYGRIIVQTNEVTNYVTVNNVVVNQSINVQNIERASNRRVETVEARTVMRGRAAVVRPVTAGRQIEQRERRERPIPANANAGGVGRDNDARANAIRARQDARNAARNDNANANANAPNGRGPAMRNDRDPPGNNQADRLERREERFENRGRFGGPQGPQNGNGNANGPQNANGNGPDNDNGRGRLENRGRVGAPQNANAPSQDGNATVGVGERPARERPGNVRQNAQPDRGPDRAVVRGGGGGNNPPAVQPAAGGQNEAAPVPAGGQGGGRPAAREQREERGQGEDKDNADRAKGRRNPR
jgi:hypothetical protein